MTEQVIDKPGSTILDDTNNQIEYFASQFEFEVYKVLRQYVTDSQIFLQVPILLKPPTAYSSKVTYNCDFAVNGTAALLRGQSQFICGLPLYIEAKGMITPDAKLKLQWLEAHQAAVRQNMLIVSQKSEHYFGKNYPPSLTLKELAAFFGDCINNYESNRKPAT